MRVDYYFVMILEVSYAYLRFTLYNYNVFLYLYTQRP